MDIKQGECADAGGTALLCQLYGCYRPHGAGGTVPAGERGAQGAGDAGLLYEASKPRRAGEACLRGASGERRR